VNKLPLIVLLVSSMAPGSTAEAADRPNVLFIICDDLNDTIEGMGGHPQAKTPNIDHLCQSGVRFLNAHCANPVCGPSRASLWTGLYPHTTGIYGHNQNKFTWRDSPVLKNAVCLFEHFQANGYTTYASGKIFHNNHHTVPLFRQQSQHDRFGAPASFGPFPWDGKARHGFNVRHPSMKRPWGENGFETFAPLSDVPRVPADPEKSIPGFDGWYDRGKLFRYNGPDDRERMVDEFSADWFVERMAEQHETPFLITIGFLRPHCPWIAPQKYFDMFPLEDVQFPPYLQGDLNDCAGVISGLKRENSWYRRFERLQQAYPGDEGWRRWIQGYLACVAFVDDQLGRLLRSLEESPYARNTIVVFTSDHGFHMGEKNLLCKKTVWEESTRVPLVIRAPGVTESGGTCRHPVSLVDLYPTLVDLCGLPEQPNADGNGYALDGYSLRPFLDDPDAKSWEGPAAALSCIEGGDPVETGVIAKPKRQHFAVRGPRFRYALWNTGEEELYDHNNDPHEWRNLAGRPEYADVQKLLRTALLDMSGQLE
jgi:arylsulfatase A-like enzyme